VRHKQTNKNNNNKSLDIEIKTRMISYLSRLKDKNSNTLSNQKYFISLSFQEHGSLNSKKIIFVQMDTAILD
jgi:hypothetical protein